MTKLHTVRARRSSVRNKPAHAEADIEREMPLLAAIAREIRTPGDNVASRLPAAYRLLRNVFQSIETPHALKDVA